MLPLKKLILSEITLTRAIALLLFINFPGYMSWFLIYDDLLMTLVQSFVLRLLVWDYEERLEPRISSN